MTVLIRYEIDVQKGTIKGLNINGNMMIFNSVSFYESPFIIYRSNLNNGILSGTVNLIGDYTETTNAKDGLEQTITFRILKDANHEILYVVKSIELADYLTKYDNL